LQSACISRAPVVKTDLEYRKRVEFGELKRLDIRTIEQAMGEGDRRLLDSEKPVMEKLRRVRDF
jgi:hypothetical protein